MGSRAASASSDALLIVGDSPTTAADLEAWRQYGIDCDVCCLNRAGLTYQGEFQYWFSWHADLLREWGAQRPGIPLWSHHKHPSVNYAKLPVRVSGGGSALAATYAALIKWGYRKIVLAGVPLSGPYKNKFLPAFERLHRELSPAVRSLSGNTLDLFGPPTQEWLNDISQ